MAWYSLGSIYIKEEKFGDALSCFDYAAIINPKYVPAHLNMGNIHFMNEKYEEAIECFKKILEVSSEGLPASNAIKRRPDSVIVAATARERFMPCSCLHVRRSFLEHASWATFLR